jgi:hypothetical protein
MRNIVVVSTKEEATGHRMCAGDFGHDSLVHIVVNSEHVAGPWQQIFLA